MLAFDGEYYGFLLTRKINIQNFCNLNVLIDIFGILSFSSQS